MLSGQFHYQGKAAASSFQISNFQNTGKFKLGRFAETIIYICAYFNLITIDSINKFAKNA